MLRFLQQLLGSSGKFPDFLFEIPGNESQNCDPFSGLTFFHGFLSTARRY
jgi:hypothetical protein